MAHSRHSNSGLPSGCGWFKPGKRGQRVIAEMRVKPSASSHVHLSGADEQANFHPFVICAVRVANFCYNIIADLLCLNNPKLGRVGVRCKHSLWRRARRVNRTIFKRRQAHRNTSKTHNKALQWNAGKHPFFVVNSVAASTELGVKCQKIQEVENAKTRQLSTSKWFRYRKI